MDIGIEEYGTDINSNWNFIDNDLTVVSDENNIKQAVLNRLNTLKGSLDVYYVDYGSLLLKYLGWKKEDKTLEFIKLELDTTLAKDPRIKNFVSNIEYTGSGVVRIGLTVKYNENDEFNLNMILSSDGIIEEE